MDYNKCLQKIKNKEDKILVEECKLKVGKYYNSTIPTRLSDNTKTKYANIYKWEDASRTNNNGEYYIKDWIDAAFDRKNNEIDKIENSRLQMEENLE